MSRLVLCDGCGLTMSRGNGDSAVELTAVELVVGLERARAGRTSHAADLCPSCLRGLLTAFFGDRTAPRLELHPPGWLA